MSSGLTNAPTQSNPPDLLSGSSPADQSNNDRGGETPYVSMELGGAGIPPVPKEEDDENASIAASIVSSVMTADGIHDVEGFIVVCFVILIGDMSRGVMFPTLWPLVYSIGGSTIDLGYAVAAFSGGRILVNPIFGSWSVSLGYTKTLMVSVSVLMLGTLVYAQVQNVGRPQFLILAQLILGIGSGTLGVTRAFVADVTAQRNRTTYIAWITAVQYAGFTVTPFLGSLFTKILGESDFQTGPFRMNMYTAPAYFMTLICAFTLYLLIFHFQNRMRIPSVKEKKKSSRREALDEFANTRTIVGLTIYDACLLGCMLLNISTKGSIASFETLGIKYAQSHFNLFSAKAGAIVATCGSLGVVSLLLMGKLTAYLTDVQLISGGMVVMATGIASLTTMKEDAQNPTWRYCAAIFMIYSIGYPIGHTAVIGLFSKIVGRRAQGVLQGWFASAGSLARMIFPISSGYVANYEDISVLFIILTVVLTVSTIFVLVSRRTLSILSA